jgi:hypothetical protein
MFDARGNLSVQAVRTMFKKKLAQKNQPLVTGYFSLTVISDLNTTFESF